MKPNMRGVGIALITPFSEDGSVDFGALEALVERVTAGGADYLVVLGTTAETPTLTADEKEAVVSCVVRKNNGRLPVVLGMGGNNTAEVVASIRKTDFTGIDAILTVTPYYNKPSQEGIYQHYKAVAAAAPCGVVLYGTYRRQHESRNRAAPGARLSERRRGQGGQRMPVAGGLYPARPAGGIRRGFRRR